MERLHDGSAEPPTSNCKWISPAYPYIWLWKFGKQKAERFSIAGHVVINRLHHHARFVFVHKAGCEQRHGLAFVVRVNERALAPAESLGGAVVISYFFGEHRFVAHQLIMNAVF